MHACTLLYMHVTAYKFISFLMKTLIDKTTTRSNSRKIPIDIILETSGTRISAELFTISEPIMTSLKAM